MLIRGATPILTNNKDKPLKHLQCIAIQCTPAQIQTPLAMQRADISQTLLCTAFD